MTIPSLASGYDVVILGGGVAGCVLAARLSEDPGRTVCLVEAGPDYGARQEDWPGKILDSRALPREDVWERHTESYRIRARVLGGSSCVNGAWNTWGSHADHAEWTRAGGDRWSAGALEPYRLRAVERMGLRTVPDSELSAWASAALVAARELGYPEVDMGTPGRPGHGRPLLNSVDGLRWNAAFAYLDPATRSRPNLTILAGALVDRLSLRGGRVTGAHVVLDGRPVTLTAGTCVLASGTFGSPPCCCAAASAPPPTWSGPASAARRTSPVSAPTCPTSRGSSSPCPPRTD